MMSRFAQTLRGLAPCNPLNCYTRATRFVSQLIVTKLSFYTTDEDLVTLCSPFGVVKGARLIMDPKTRRHRGYGFVTFEKEIEAQKAVKALNGRVHMRRPSWMPRRDDVTPLGIVCSCLYFLLTCLDSVNIMSDFETVTYCFGWVPTWPDPYSVG
ncbi:hypothetical protein Dimus_013700 [Dionaea muscipula]